MHEISITTFGYLDPRELHQMNEKVQVACVARRLGGLRCCHELAA